MRYQLRDYDVRPGEMDAWLGEWMANIRPMREKFGFQVVGAWRVEAQERFVWILGYEGEGGFEEADRRYYESPDRRALVPDPARHLVETRKQFIERV
jgi:hypothetical protein